MNRVFPGHIVTCTTAGFDLSHVEMVKGATITFVNEDVVMLTLEWGRMSWALLPGCSLDMPMTSDAVFTMGEHSCTVVVK